MTKELLDADGQAGRVWVPDSLLNTVTRSEKLSRLLGCDLSLKMEHKQRTGSFKLRGAHSKLSLMAQQQQQTSIVTASTGNHGLACVDAMATYNIRGKVSCDWSVLSS